MTGSSTLETAWIDDAMWERVQRLLPIVCVDLLPVQADRRNGSLLRIGLILRETPHEGRKWCTLGGRLRYGENIAEGIKRQLRETLGASAGLAAPADAAQPLFVAQYEPVGSGRERASGFDAIDPRKHAVGLTYGVEVTGELKPSGEALDFRWFEWYDIPEGEDIGFEQRGIIKSCIRRFRSMSRN